MHRSSGRPEASAEHALVSWEAARSALVRADLKARLLRFDPRCLLTTPALVNSVKARVDAKVTATMPLHSSVRARDTTGRKVAASAPSTISAVASSASAARESSGGGEGEGARAETVLTYEDARCASQMASEGH